MGTFPHPFGPEFKYLSRMEQIRESGLRKLYASYVSWVNFPILSVISSVFSTFLPSFCSATTTGLQGSTAYRGCGSWRGVGEGTTPLGVGPRHSHLLRVALLHFSPLLVLTALGFVYIKEGFPCKPLSVTAPHPSDEKVAATQTLRAIHGPCP